MPRDDETSVAASHSEKATSDLTSLCRVCELYVRGTDGDGACPRCAADPSWIEDPKARRRALEGYDLAETLAEDTADEDAETPVDGEPAATGGVLDNDQEATDSARSLAAEQGVDLAQVQGTGAGGRVTRADVEAYLKARSA